MSSLGSVKLYGDARATSEHVQSGIPAVVQPTRGEPVIHDIFETKTSTWQYIVADPATLTAVIIDPVLDYDPTTQVIATHMADALLALARERGYKIDRILETHAHADHVTAASYLQDRLARETGHRPLIGIGKGIVRVQELFSRRYGVPDDEFRGVFDVLLRMTVRDHKQANRHIKAGTTEDEFVTMRRERDAGLGEPRLLHQSLQMNIRAGKLPRPTDARHQLLHIPLRVGEAKW
ncbi:unnamed protein product [Parascedosporium putredinis]|uniref:Metallo-beta-lactamase domain-containing protein n=1 Tax=Parascedosporium putredinis TaxID=1442378 RepID=A0A9P1GY38_9PEZI|nr:unnamed protein product [Parascedosporium putredinis]CAI7990381.1 unnamed protein product [Parascedosporium putredinis]